MRIVTVFVLLAAFVCLMPASAQINTDSEGPVRAMTAPRTGAAWPAAAATPSMGVTSVTVGGFIQNYPCYGGACPPASTYRRA